METSPASRKGITPPASVLANEGVCRSGEELWKLLDYSTGKRIKGHWRDVPKMVTLFTRANARHSFGMSCAEIQHLAEYIHDQNRPRPGTIEEYVALWPLPLDGFNPVSESRLEALLALDRLIRELPAGTGPVHCGTD